MSKIDKRLDRCTAASTIDDLTPYEGRVFKMVRHNALTVVQLDKVKDRKVYLKRMQDQREDGFSLSVADFRKFYWLAPSNAANAKAEQNG